MDRMAEHTKQPDVLQELFDALDNDPFVIAECLARPALAEQLIAKSHAHGQRNPGERRQIARATVAPADSYTLPTIGGGECVDDTWTGTSTNNAPSARQFHTAVWTGSEMIVWGGTIPILEELNTGGRYNPATDSWTATSTTNAPHSRFLRRCGPAVR